MKTQRKTRGRAVFEATKERVSRYNKWSAISSKIDKKFMNWSSCVRFGGMEATGPRKLNAALRKSNCGMLKSM